MTRRTSNTSIRLDIGSHINDRIQPRAKRGGCDARSAGSRHSPWLVLLCVVDREPSLRPHTKKDVPGDVPRAFDVRVAQLGAEITAREGTPIALKACRFNRDNRP